MRTDPKLNSFSSRDLKECISMKFLIAILSVISSAAMAAPEVRASFVNANAAECASQIDIAEACAIARNNTKILRERLFPLKVDSDEYRKWAPVLPMVQD